MAIVVCWPLCAVALGLTACAALPLRLPTARLCLPGWVQVIPYLTVYAVLPSSLLFLVAYSWGTQRFRWVGGRACMDSPALCRLCCCTLLLSPSKTAGCPSTVCAPALLCTASPHILPRLSHPSSCPLSLPACLQP